MFCSCPKRSVRVSRVSEKLNSAIENCIESRILCQSFEEVDSAVKRLETHWTGSVWEKDVVSLSRETMGNGCTMKPIETLEIRLGKETENYMKIT